MQLSSAEIVSLSVVNHQNYSLYQEKHQYLRYANGFQDLLASTSSSKESPVMATGVCEMRLNIWRRVLEFFSGENERSSMGRAARATRKLSSYTLLAPMGNNTIAW